jgi:hypothetical protein
MKKLMLLIMLLCLVPTVFVTINIDNLLAEAVIPFKPAEEAVIPFKPAPEWPSLKEHLIFFVRHLLEYQFSPISIDIIFQESSWGMSKEQS